MTALKTALAVALFPVILLAAFCCRWVMSDKQREESNE